MLYAQVFLILFDGKVKYYFYFAKSYIRVSNKIEFFLYQIKFSNLTKTTNSVIVIFKGHNEGTISVTEGELLFVIEEDKGDGWTRVRRNEDEEGYVPTSYVEVFLETNAKGAMTYI